MNQVLSLKKLLPILVLTASFSLIFSCANNPEVKPEVLAVTVDTDIVRFDLEFDKASESEIPQLKAKYPQLFPQQYPDSFWIAKKRDTLLQALAREVQKSFPDFSEQEEQLRLLFQHLKYCSTLSDCSSHNMLPYPSQHSIPISCSC